MKLKRFLLRYYPPGENALVTYIPVKISLLRSTQGGDILGDILLSPFRKSLASPCLVFTVVVRMNRSFSCAQSEAQRGAARRSEA